MPIIFVGVRCRASPVVRGLALTILRLPRCMHFFYAALMPALATRAEAFFLVPAVYLCCVGLSDFALRLGWRILLSGSSFVATAAAAVSPNVRPQTGGAAVRGAPEALTCCACLLWISGSLRVFVRRASKRPLARESVANPASASRICFIFPYPWVYCCPPCGCYGRSPRRFVRSPLMEVGIS